MIFLQATPESSDLMSPHWGYRTEAQPRLGGLWLYLLLAHPSGQLKLEPSDPNAYKGLLLGPSPRLLPRSLAIPVPYAKVASARGGSRTRQVEAAKLQLPFFPPGREEGNSSEEVGGDSSSAPPGGSQSSASGASPPARAFP